MDRIDKNILTLLQNNSRLTNQELADAVSLSPSPCLRRVKQLEEKKIIQKYVALLNPEALGIHLTVLASIGIEKHTPKEMREFEEAVKKIPEVLQCYLITGHTADYILKIVVSNMAHYQKILLEHISQIKGVKTVHSSFVMQTVLDRTDLPLDFV